MSLLLASWLVRAAYAYIIIGVILLPWWLARGLRRLDTSAGTRPWGFRVLTSPGLVALWSWLLARARNGSGQPPAERNGVFARDFSSKTCAI